MVGAVEKEGFEEREGGDDAGRAIGERSRRFVVDVARQARNLPWKRGTVATL